MASGTGLRNPLRIAQDKLAEVREWAERPAAEISAPGRPRLNVLRGVVARFTTPLLPDDYLHLVNPLWSARELRGRVVEVRKETEDSATLVIKPGWGFDFEYVPGQFIGIGILIDGRWRWRSYSLTSPPNWEGKLITIAVKAMPEGLLSSHLVNGVPAGTIVRLAAPQGDFQLPTPPPDKLLFVTAGSGITPVLAMLRAMDRHGDMPDVIHVHSAPEAKDVMFAEELARLDETHSNYRLVTRLTNDVGILSPTQLAELIGDWTERHTWACGPGPMLDALENFWAEHEGAQRLHTERFEISRIDTEGLGGSVTFGQRHLTVEADGATTLLEVGEENGVRMPFGCRMGICKTCVVPLTAGHVVDLRSGTTHWPGERIQTCISVAAGACTLDV